MDKPARTERPERKRREARPLDPGTGEGAASALATLRALERSRNACAPAEEVQLLAPSRLRSSPKPGTS